MKWILLAIGAVIVFWFLRRLGREQSSVAYPADATAANPMAPDPISGPDGSAFAMRSPMSLDEFYTRYYAADNIDRAFVEKVLGFISKAGGVPAGQLRPEDRLDSLPKHAVYRWVQFMQKMLESGIRQRAAEQGMALPQFHLETIDDIIRQLEPHHLEAFKVQGFSGDS